MDDYIKICDILASDIEYRGALGEWLKYSLHLNLKDEVVRKRL